MTSNPSLPLARRPNRRLLYENSRMRSVGIIAESQLKSLPAQLLLPPPPGLDAARSLLPPLNYIGHLLNSQTSPALWCHTTLPPPPTTRFSTRLLAPRLERMSRRVRLQHCTVASVCAGSGGYLTPHPPL